MSFCLPKSWLLYGVVLFICIVRSVNALAFNCTNGMCQCATGSTGKKTTFLEKFLCDEDPDCEDGSDESNCAQGECLPTEHKCGNGRCLRSSWVCDNYADCHDGSDEKQSLCNYTTCAPDQFRCYNGFCLPGLMRCDRTIECLGGEDEHGCTYPTNCSADLFQCNNTKCISKSFLCDGEDDCGDNTDEADCKTCSPTSFTCKSGNCIPQNLKCNGQNDCLDGSDEDSCPTVAPLTCSTSEFLCDGACQPDFWRCDGDLDCADGADESGCDGLKCSDTERLCDNKKKCIKKWNYCDGSVDCDDESDEKSCQVTSTTAAPKTEFTCGADEYKCKDVQKCIKKRNICDKNHDCPGGDDELSCSIPKCGEDNGNCSHRCHATDAGYHCSCKPGFKLLDDSKTCEDVNECKQIGKCSQVCTNTEGSYKCSCSSGYFLSPNGRNCFPKSGKKEKVLVAVGLDVRSVEHDGTQIKCIVEKNVKNVVAVGVHHQKNMMFWADTYVGKIFSLIIDRKDVPAKVVACVSAGSYLQDLAVDWITDKLYWLTTAKLVSTIHVSEFNGSNWKIVHSVQENIHSIAVDPLGGYLYWTSLITKKISRAFMNGENKEDIIKTSLELPTGLTIDYPNNKLFWLDSKMHRIESSDLDGKNRRHIPMSDLRHAFDIAVFGDKLYWSDSILKTVFSANKFTGKNKTMLVSRENITSFVPKGISIHHSLSQPHGINHCKNNSGCSHLCLLKPNAFQCACPETGILEADKKTCKMPAKPPSRTTILQPTATTTDSTQTEETKPGHATKKPKPAKSERSGLNAQILGGIIAGVVFMLLILLIVTVWWCRKKKNTKATEIYYCSKSENVKVNSTDGKNPTQSKKDVDRDAYFKFADKNFTDFDVGEDEDVDNIDEKQPVFKTFKRQDEESLIQQMV